MFGILGQNLHESDTNEFQKQWMGFFQSLFVGFVQQAHHRKSSHLVRSLSLPTLHGADGAIQKLGEVFLGQTKDGSYLAHAYARNCISQF